MHLRRRALFYRYDRPREAPPLPMLEDTAVWQPFSRGKWLDIALEAYAPHPWQYRRVWEKRVDKGQSVYAWVPVPPGEQYVALGMLYTTTADQPPPEAMRCMHRSWCRESQTPPVEVWNDRGLGGKPGSLWTVNNLQCAWATAGYGLEITVCV